MILLQITVNLVAFRALTISLLPILFWDRVLFCSLGWPITCYVFRAGFKKLRAFHLPLPLDCWDRRCMLPYLAGMFVLIIEFDGLLVFINMVWGGVARSVTQWLRSGIIWMLAHSCVWWWMLTWLSAQPGLLARRLTLHFSLWLLGFLTAWLTRFKKEHPKRGGWRDMTYLT